MIIKFFIKFKMTSAARQAKKFDLNTYDVDGSSSDDNGKFNTIDPPGMHDNDNEEEKE